MADPLLGVEGGGTKTVALVADGKERVLGRGEGGPSNIYAAGKAVAYASLEEAIGEALLAAETTPTEVGGVCLGLAGIGRPEDRALIERWVDAHFQGIPSCVVNDTQLVLTAGTPEGWGIAVVAGTGSHIYGQDPEGHTARAGGWGYILGDEGSGYAIGLAGLRAVVRAVDRRDPPTMLTQAILAHWGLGDLGELVQRVYDPAHGRLQIAELSAVVQQCALDGDAVAQRIVAEAASELVVAVKAVIEQLALTPPIPCALAGGAIVKGVALQRAFVEQVRSLGLQLAPITPVPEPAMGALRIAKTCTERFRAERR